MWSKQVDTPFLELVGTETNRDGVGARVTLQTDQRKLTGEVHSGSGFLSQSSRRVHFGLLDKESTQALEVRLGRAGRSSGSRRFRAMVCFALPKVCHV